MFSQSRNSSAPIGIFDSGVGGLAVYRAVKELLPHEDLIYIADSGFGPYGEREPGYIESRVEAMAGLLVKLNAKAIVVACNTATVIAVEQLRNSYGLPIVGIEPAIKPAVATTRSKRIVVLATQRTLESKAVERLCRLYGTEVEILLQPCPGLVDQVERGSIDNERTKDLLRGYIHAAIRSDVDTVVLGCTHFVFLEAQIRALVGPDIAIVEPSRAVARQLVSRLGTQGRPREPGYEAKDQFFTSAESPVSASAIMSNLLGRCIEAKSTDTNSL